MIALFFICAGFMGSALGFVAPASAKELALLFIAGAASGSAQTHYDQVNDHWPNERFFYIEPWRTRCWLDDSGARYVGCVMQHREESMTLTFSLSQQQTRFRAEKECDPAMTLHRETDLALGDHSRAEVERNLREIVAYVASARCPNPLGGPPFPSVPSYPEGYFQRAYETLLLMKTF